MGWGGLGWVGVGMRYVRVICLQMSVERAIAKFIELSRVGGKPSAARVSAENRAQRGFPPI